MGRRQVCGLGGLGWRHSGPLLGTPCAWWSG